MANDQRVGLRLTGDLRDTLEREADDAGITLSALVRQRVLMTHPHIAGNMATTPFTLVGN